jgi:hypothetical protein
VAALIELSLSRRHSSQVFCLCKKLMKDSSLLLAADWHLLVVHTSEDFPPLPLLSLWLCRTGEPDMLLHDCDNISGDGCMRREKTSSAKYALAFTMSLCTEFVTGTKSLGCGLHIRAPLVVALPLAAPALNDLQPRTKLWPKSEMAASPIDVLSDAAEEEVHS